MDISIELVPRSHQYLETTLSDIQHQLPAINMINIPDIQRIDMRSWEGCQIASSYYTSSIPHLRAVDTAPNEPLPMLQTIRRAGVQKVLVVTGDWDSDTPPAVSSLELIRRLKAEAPELAIYAALDPYRQDVLTEVAYAREKLAAGASGFFTQPFFDLRLAEIYAEQLAGIEIYWGVAPVTTDRSRRYWQKRNKAIFPTQFDCSLAWNRAFAARMLRFASNRGDHIYFMPIRVNIVDYLRGIV